MPDFISSLVPWKRQNAVALLEHIETTTGRHWLRALADAWDVSEYTLYGRFVRDVLGASGGQFVSSSPLCMDYYKRVPLTVPELTTFLDSVGHEAIAVSLTSKAGMKPGDYVEMLERQWAAQERDDEVEPTRVPARVAGRGSTQPSRDRAPARRATVSRVGSPPRRRRLITRQARPGVAVALGALAGLMMVLLGLGID